MTPRQRQFAYLIADGIPPVEAARQAGYRSPRQAVYLMLTRPRQVRDIIKARVCESGAGVTAAMLGGVFSTHHRSWHRVWRLVCEELAATEHPHLLALRNDFGSDAPPLTNAEIELVASMGGKA